MEIKGTALVTGTKVRIAHMVGHDGGAPTDFVRLCPSTWLLNGITPVSPKRAEELEAAFQSFRTAQRTPAEV